VIIYLFRDQEAGNFAITRDVTGRNLPSLTSSTDWIFVEPIGPLRPPRWEPADFQCLLNSLSADGFYLFEAGVKDPKKLPAGWVRPRPQ
jgi:hypothetical protein